MNPQIRLRRHTDGRVALNRGELWPGSGDRWEMTDFPESHRGVRYISDGDTSGHGWSELFVAELPEPDGWANAVGDNGQDAATPYWEPGYGGSITAWTDGVETSENGLEPDLEQLRSDTLKMLAAVAACEKYRAEREATT